MLVNVGDRVDNRAGHGYVIEQGVAKLLTLVGEVFYILFGQLVTSSVFAKAWKL